MKQNITLLRVTVGDNELQLVKELKFSNKYILLWGEKGNERLSKKELKTPSGRIMSASRARKMFFQAIDAARYFTFKKVTVEEILERAEQENNK